MCPSRRITEIRFLYRSCLITIATFMMTSHVMIFTKCRANKNKNNNKISESLNALLRDALTTR